MRTEPSSPLASALDRLRSSAERARRWVAGRGAATRVGLMVAALGALVVAGYLASPEDGSARSWAWLYEDRRLSADDIAAITAALDAEGIPHAADRSAGRVGVKPEARASALSALAKRKAVPATLDELGRDDEVGSIFDDPAARERHDRRVLERRLKRQIEKVDSAIVSASVQVHRDRGRGLDRRDKVAAFVYLETEGGRELGHRAVKGIARFLAGAVPDLGPEAITVVDATGREYLVAGDPSLEERVQAHAQEETWRDRIAEGLSHIPGLGVSVLLEAVPIPPPAPVVEAPPPAPAELVRPNGSLEVGPEPSPVAALPALPAPSAPIKARVWVRVPRSWYYRAAESRAPNRAPTDDELQAIVATTRQLIHDAVEATIPREILGNVNDVKIDTVQDDLAINPRALLIPPDPESRLAWLWPGAVGGDRGGGRDGRGRGVACGGRRGGRCRGHRARVGPRTSSPTGRAARWPGPSERVRELIRLDPEAAAGVLQRWVGQGEAPR